MAQCDGWNFKNNEFYNWFTVTAARKIPLVRANCIMSDNSMVINENRQEQLCANSLSVHDIYTEHDNIQMHTQVDFAIGLSIQWIH